MCLTTPPLTLKMNFWFSQCGFVHLDGLRLSKYSNTIIVVPYMIAYLEYTAAIAAKLHYIFSLPVGVAYIITRTSAMGKEIMSSFPRLTPDFRRMRRGYLQAPPVVLLPSRKRRQHAARAHGTPDQTAPGRYGGIENRDWLMGQKETRRPVRVTPAGQTAIPGFGAGHSICIRRPVSHY